MSRFSTVCILVLGVLVGFSACKQPSASPTKVLSLSTATDPFGIRVVATESTKAVSRDTSGYSYSVSTLDASKVAVIRSGDSPVLTGGEIAILNADTGLITPMSSGTISITATAADGTSGSISVALKPIDLAALSGTSRTDGSGAVATLWQMTSYVIPEGNALGGSGSELPSGTYTRQNYDASSPSTTDPLNMFTMNYGLMIVGNVADEAVSGVADGKLSSFNCNSLLNAGFAYNADCSTYGPVGGGTLSDITSNYKFAWKVVDHVLTCYPIGGGSATYTVNGNTLVATASTGVRANLTAVSSLTADKVSW